MSYDEYSDLFEKAQSKDTKYVAYVFDIKNSKGYSNKERYIVQMKTFETINMVTKRIKLIEKIAGKKILIDEPLMKVTDDIFKKVERPALPNPCFTQGDCFAFFCYNHTMSDKKMKHIFEVCAKKCDNNYPYHFASGKFETLDYVKGAKEYYAGYILEQISKKVMKDHKDEIVNELTK